MDDELYEMYMRHIVLDLDYCSRKDNIIPTINSTAEAVAKKKNLPMEQVRATIIKMLDEGYLYQRIKYVEFNRKVKVICPKWEKLIEDGIWDPEKMCIRDRLYTGECCRSQTDLRQRRKPLEPACKRNTDPRLRS